MKRKWIACCSQTGSEILNIARALNRFPDIVLTNTALCNLTRPLFDFYTNDKSKSLIRVFNPLTSETYDSVFSQHPKAIITLNGWLRIVPADICEKYSIYNGHPGLITKYPELKGKDPVQRVWENYDQYSEFGSVIHKVSPGVDEGEIILSDSKELNVECFEDLDREQREISLKLWIKFLKEYI